MNYMICFNDFIYTDLMNNFRVDSNYKVLVINFPVLDLLAMVLFKDLSESFNINLLYLYIF